MATESQGGEAPRRACPRAEREAMMPRPGMRAPASRTFTRSSLESAQSFAAAPRAFSLIELLVVVAIIALLVAILLPSLSGAREQAKRAVCASNLRQVGVGIYHYWHDWNGRVPWVWSPMTNNYFGKATVPDSQVDPFDRVNWRSSLPNVLTPLHLADTPKLFVCPSAKRGWPRNGGALRYTYRPASINQPNGVESPEGSYQREHFGFLDGRMLAPYRMKLTGDPINDEMQAVQRRGTYIRDLIIRDGEQAIGPHNGGIMVIDRDMQVRFRDRKTTSEDLALGQGGAQF